MFGWRARIGFLSPSPGGPPTSLLEMQMAAPEGVAFISRALEGPTSLEVDVLRAMEPQIGPAAKALAHKAGLDLILMGGAPVVLANDPANVARLMSEATGLPATTNVAGIVNGVIRLGLARVVVMAPYYPQHLLDLVRDHLVTAGIDVVSVITPADVPFSTHKELRAEDTYRRAKTAFLAAPEADGLVLVGGGAPLHPVLEILETDIGKPVVANNHASLWNALTMVNVRQPIHGYGKLLTCF